MPRAFRARPLLLVALLALLMPAAAAGCCGNTKIAEDDKVEALPPIPGGREAITAPEVTWQYLVEAIVPEFEPPVIHPDTQPDKLVGRPVRFWYLLSSSLRDRIGSYKAFKEAWPDFRKRAMATFQSGRQPKERPPTEGEPEVGATDALTLVSDGGGPAITLHFIYEYDPNRFVNEAAAVWRLQDTDLEQLFAPLMPGADNEDDESGNGGTDGD